MAPPNPFYSEDVKQLTNSVLETATKTTLLTISDFNVHIQNLWEALLAENFVFSFKNTLAIWCCDTK